MAQRDTLPRSPVESPPLVSIGIPVFNGAGHLAEALGSALAQDYPNFEVIVCDNASEDGTEAIGRRFEQLDPRVRYLRAQANVGLIANFRRTLTQARGTYFTWLAHDDVLSDPAYLTTVVEHLEHHPATVTCTTAFHILNSEFGMAGELVEFPEIAPERWPRSRQEFFRWPHGWVEALAIYGVHRRDCLLQVTLPERTHRGRPHIFWWETDVVTSLCALGPVVSLPHALRAYRLAVLTEGTGMSGAYSTFDLYRIGLRTKLILIGRACRMPGPGAERIRLVGTALANLFRANLGQPYDHAFVRRNWEVAVAALQRAARERRQAIESLSNAIAERREALLSLSVEPGPLPEAVAQALAEPRMPSPDEALRVRQSGKAYSRGLLIDFFRPPAGWQIDAARRLQAAVGSLTVVCWDLLKTMDILNAEAQRLATLLDSAAAAGSGTPA